MIDCRICNKAMGSNIFRAHLKQHNIRENADIKSAKIIKKRVASDVHRNKLLKLNKFEQFVPKLNSYKQIKSILSDLFECSYKTSTEVRVNE